MEDVLDLYEETYDPKRPTVCFDETSKQLIGEKRLPLPAQPGQPERYDYEYKRNGTRNLFMFCEPHRGWRHVELTYRRTMQDFAQQMRWLVDVAYPEAELIRVILDNLNTHKPASLYETFPLRPDASSGGWRFTTPLSTAPGSIPFVQLDWMAEIELSALSSQCLDQRIPDEHTLKQELAAYQQRRNEARATINWRFTSSDAWVKLHRLYPSLSD